MKRLRLLFRYAATLLAAFAVTAVLTGPAARAAETQTGTVTVTGASVNVREGAGTGYASVGKARNAETYAVTGQETASNGTVWYRISFGGVQGYISSACVSYTPDGSGDPVPEPGQTGTVTVTGKSVNVRSGAGTGYVSVGKVLKAQAYPCFGSEIAANGTVWYLIRVSSAVQGYISGTYASFTALQQDPELPEDPPKPEDPVTGDIVTVTGSSVNVRSGAGTSYAAVAAAKKGDTYAYIGEAKDANGTVWYNIRISGTLTGYIISTYAEHTGGNVDPEPPEDPPKPEGIVTVTGNSVNVRSGAGTSYAAVASAKKGETYAYLGEAKDANGTVWYSIRISNTLTGYIISAYAEHTAGTVDPEPPEDPQKPEDPGPEGTVTVTGGSVNVRRGPGTSYAVILTAAKGNTYAYLGEDKDANGTVWYNIRISDTVSGWISGAYASYGQDAPAGEPSGDGPLVFISPSKQIHNLYIDGVTTEKENMCAIGQLVGKILESKGVRVVVSPESMSRDESIAWANGHDVAVYVALHSNAVGVANTGTRGCEVWTRKSDAGSLALSRQVYAEVSALTPTADRGIKTSDTLRELVDTKAGAACLVEVDFHDSTAGCNWLKNNRQAIAEAVARGILAYLGL